MSLASLSSLEFLKSHSKNELALTAFAIIGAGYISSYLLSFSRMLLDFARPGMSLKKFGATKGAWAVVTGATAGIGKDFALQLAKGGFNILLASRSVSKLEEIRAEIKAKYPNVETRIHAIDFSAATNADYITLGAVIESMDVGVLINNVGKSYDEPVFFQNLPDQDLKDIIEINVNATLRVTKLVIPGMVARKKGLILTVGSFAALIPSPLLAVYSASKAFLTTWSQALGSELRGSGVHVELLNTYFVVSKLSKIRKSSWMIPTPSTYVRAVLSHIGQNGGAVGQPHISNPYLAHALIQWVVDHFMTYTFWLKYNRDLHVDIRRRVLRKKERDAKAAAKGGKEA